MNSIDLIDFYKIVYSQHGQDGILEKIFDCIGTVNKQFVEFGSCGMKTGQGNTIYLRENFGWSGLLMDGSEYPYGIKIQKDYEVKIHFVKASNINSLLQKYNVSKELDFMSIDIDGQDWHIWKAIDDTLFRTRVICIETSWDMYGDRDLVMKPDEDYIWDGTYLSGSSLLALQRLGNSKGYTLVSMVGADAIFVRADILIEKGIQFINQDNAYELWQANPDCRIRGNIQDDYTSCGNFGTSSDFL